MQERNVYAIGGYLQNFEHRLIGFLVDFKEADSACAAYCVALTEAIQCAIEEFGCIESDLQIRTPSKELVNWECRFVMNKVKLIKRWLKKISPWQRQSLQSFVTSTCGKKNASSLSRGKSPR